jgi:hypothetical protein
MLKGLRIEVKQVGKPRSAAVAANVSWRTIGAMGVCQGSTESRPTVVFCILQSSFAPSRRAIAPLRRDRGCLCLPVDPARPLRQANVE